MFKIKIHTSNLPIRWCLYPFPRVPKCRRFTSTLFGHLSRSWNEIMEIGRRPNGKINLLIPQSRNNASLYKITPLQTQITKNYKTRITHTKHPTIPFIYKYIQLFTCSKNKKQNLQKFAKIKTCKYFTQSKFLYFCKDQAI